jgi:hypothetical protein
MPKDWRISPKAPCSLSGNLCAFSGDLEAPIAVHLERMLERLDAKLRELGLLPFA